MDIDKLFESDSLDGIADNVFGVVNNSVSEVKEMQRKKVAENVQLVVNALKKIESDISSRYDSVGNALEKRIITIKDGRDGADGRDGRNGKDGKNGRDGAPGPRGADGKNGLDGADGADGVSVTNAHIDFDGSLVISLSSGQELNVGEVVAPALAEQIKVITNGGGTSQSVIDTLASLQAQITAISGASIYKGLWNASTNTPALASGVGTSGNFYIVSVAGSTNLDGITNWGIGDWAIYNGTAWQRVEGGAAGNFTTVTASSLTSGRVTYAGTAGLLQDSASLTFDGTTLTSGGFTTTGANATGTLTTTSTAKIGSTVASFMNGTLQVWNNTATNILVQKSQVGGIAPWIFFLKSRSTTPSTNAIVANNDGTGVLGFFGDDGAAGQPTAYISSFVDGVPSANVMPGRLTFLTNGGSTSPTERMRIASTGNTTFLPDGTTTVGTFSSTGLAVTALTNSALTSGRVTFASTAGLLADAAALTWDGTSLTATKLAGAHNGTVGATTPSTGAFTTLSATGRTTVASPTTASGRFATRSSGDANQYNCLILESYTVPNLLGIGFNGTNWCISPSYEGAGAYKDVAIFSNNSKVAEFLSTGLTVTGTAIASTSVGVGNTTPSGSGAGIAFPATQSASTDANTLDDYEEGTWTPADASGAGLTFTSVTAKYTKIGNMVYFNATLTYPTTADVSQAKISGLIFPAANVGQILIVNPGVSGGTGQGWVPNASTTLTIVTQSNILKTNANFSGLTIYLTGSYPV